MREVTICGKTFKIRNLKRKEVKALKKKGINLVGLKPEMADDAMDAVFDLVLTEEEIAVVDEFDQTDAMELWTEALKETFGSAEEEKN